MCTQSSNSLRIHVVLSGERVIQNHQTKKKKKWERIAALRGEWIPFKKKSKNKYRNCWYPRSGAICNWLRVASLSLEHVCRRSLHFSLQVWDFFPFVFLVRSDETSTSTECLNVYGDAREIACAICWMSFVRDCVTMADTRKPKIEMFTTTKTV